MWPHLLKRLLALDYASYEAFSKSGNTVVTVTGTCSKDKCHLQPVGLHESSCRLFQLCKARLAHVHSPSTTKHLYTVKKRKADMMDGEIGFTSLLWVPAGRGERQMVHSTSLRKMSSHGFTRPFSSERCGLGTRLPGYVP